MNAVDDKEHVLMSTPEEIEKMTPTVTTTSATVTSVCCSSTSSKSNNCNLSSSSCSTCISNGGHNTCTENNDCNRQAKITTNSCSGATGVCCGGARPKLQHQIQLTCNNITNGIHSQNNTMSCDNSGNKNNTLKLNNFCTGAVMVDNDIGKLNYNNKQSASNNSDGTVVDDDMYMKNNVNCCVPNIEKCPPKVNNESCNSKSDNRKLQNLSKEERKASASAISNSYSSNCNFSSSSNSNNRLNNGSCSSGVGGNKSGNSDRKNEDDDSLTENDDEEEDEYCIYTYKGDQNQMADLPSSFFRLGVVPPGGSSGRGFIGENNRERSRSSSPDMDYLEMDFDPGPSNDRDDSTSNDSDCCDMMPLDNDDERTSVNQLNGDAEMLELPRHSVSPSGSSAGNDESSLDRRRNNILEVNSMDETLPLNNYKKETNRSVLEVVHNQIPSCSWQNNLENGQDKKEENLRHQELVNNSDADLNNQHEPIFSVAIGIKCEPKNDLNGKSYNSNKTNLMIQYQCHGSSVNHQVFPQSSNSISSVNSSSFPISPSGTRDTWGYHCSSGDLCSPGDPTESNFAECFLEGESAAVDYFNKSTNRNNGQGECSNSNSSLETTKHNLRSVLYHCIMAKRLVLDKQASFTDGDQSNLEAKESGSPDSNHPVERTMIWSEQEACTKQITQIGTSLCGATAVINVMVALNIPFSLEKLKEGVATRFRNENASVPEYLFSRCFAGATHVDLIRGIEFISQNALYSRFFHLYPERDISLSRWLASWMKKGAIPIATINLQRGVHPEGTIPDVWHHQMIFGVGPRGIYMSNPLECINERALMVQLCSPPILKIRRADVISRWTPSTDLRPLINYPDVRWKRMNVLGQVVNVIREAQWSKQGHCSRTLTSHISIPASYSSGITFVIPKENPAYEQLRDTPELPLLLT